MKDLRPIIVRNSNNGLSKAEEIRDNIYNLFDKISNEENIKILKLKSPPFTSPPWIRIETWIYHKSDSFLSLRTTALFTINSKDYHRFPIEIDLEIKNDKRTRIWKSITKFDYSDAKEVLNYLLYKKEKPNFKFSRCRSGLLIRFWLPRNKSTRIGIDPISVGSQISFIIGFATMSYGIGFLFILIGAIMIYSSNKRSHYILCSGKPMQEPRRLTRLDSWQTIIKDLGSEQETIISDIIKDLRKVTKESFVVEKEKIWHWGIDGKEERVQLVVRFRRGITFIHVFSYGNDLFVGWDAHVNCGEWVENTIASGYDNTTEQICSINTISSGWHAPNEYDINDTNYLLERVHLAVTKVIKIKLAEHKIDQEIDFKILREQRQNISGKIDPTAKKGKSRLKNKFSRFHRVG